MYKLLSMFAILALAAAAPAADPAAEPVAAADPGAAILAPGLSYQYPQLGLAAYPAAHIAYSAPLAYPSYSAYPGVPLAYNKIY